MAATKLIPMHVNKGKTAAASMKERIDYAQNPDKTNGGELISSYECDPRLAWQEFMLDRRKISCHAPGRSGRRRTCLSDPSVI